MLIERYMNVNVTVGGDEYDPGETVTEEVYVRDEDIKHYIDTFLSAEDVLNYAKEIAPQEFEEGEAVDLDLAYEILIDGFDENDDIPDFKELNEYIQECVQNDYQNEAAEQYYDAVEMQQANDDIWSAHMKEVL